MKVAKFSVLTVGLLVAFIFAVQAVCALAQEGAKPQWWGKPPKEAVGERPVVHGKVAQVSDTNIAVQTPEGVKQFAVTAQTRVLVRGQKASIADVRVGDPVIVRFRPVPEGVLTALQILVPKPMIAGRIVRIEGNNVIVAEMPIKPRPNPPVGVQPGQPQPPSKARGLKAVPGARLPAQKRAPVAGAAPRPHNEKGAPVVQPRIERPEPGPERVIQVTNGTRYTSRGYEGTIQDLRVGYFVRATGNFNGEALVADHVEFLPMVAKGTVTAIENGIITVKAVRQFTVQLQPTQATVVWVKPRVAPNKRGTLNDVKVGSPVDVGYHPAGGGPGQLLWIAVYTGM